MFKQIRSFLHQYFSRDLEVSAISSVLQGLAATGFRPKLFFDGGTRSSDFARTCLTIWPNCRVVQFEALPAPEPDLFTRLDQPLLLPMLLPKEVKQSQDEVFVYTSASKLTPRNQVTTYRFPVQLCASHIVDDLVEQQFPRGRPDFLKLHLKDDGLEILRGAEVTLQCIQVLLVEFGLVDIGRGVPLRGEVISWLDTKGWSTYSVCEPVCSSPGGAPLVEETLFFLPKISVLRAK